jgi:hypothetical protein
MRVKSYLVVVASNLFGLGASQGSSPTPVCAVSFHRDIIAVITETYVAQLYPKCC